MSSLRDITAFANDLHSYKTMLQYMDGSYSVILHSPYFDYVSCTTACKISAYCNILSILIIHCAISWVNCNINVVTVDLILNA